MSKRTRGTARTSQRRPGARPPTTRPAGRARPARERAAATPESQLELAAEIAEELVEDDAGATEQPAPADRTRASRVGRASQQPRTRVKPGSLLAARAATEYVYVAKDIRRILVVSAGLFAIMVALYVLLVVARIVPLPFY